MSCTGVATLFSPGCTRISFPNGLNAPVGLDLALWFRLLLSSIFMRVSETVYHRASKPGASRSPGGESMETLAWAEEAEGIRLISAGLGLAPGLEWSRFGG